mgnify:CR=1
MLFRFRDYITLEASCKMRLRGWLYLVVTGVGVPGSGCSKPAWPLCRCGSVLIYFNWDEMANIDH